MGKLEYYETTLLAEGESLSRREQRGLLELAQQHQADAKKLRAFPKLVEALEPFAAMAEAVDNAGHLSGHAEELYCIGQIQGPPICITRTAVSDARAALALAREVSE